MNVESFNGVQLAVLQELEGVLAVGLNTTLVNE